MLIKLINYNNKLFFLYDTNVNEIIELDKEEYDYLIEKQEKEIDDIPDKFARIQSLYDNDFLQPSTIQKIEQPYANFISDYLSKRLNTVILQTTQNCNFRCRYCGFSNFGYSDREHNSGMMSIETAKKAIDFLKNNSVDMKDVSIAFYGGEPLINFKLVKEVVQYAKAIMPYKNINFDLITNFSILTDEIKQFLRDHNIQVTVSLDGPLQVHDKYRRFAANGKGTFDKVYNNLKEIFKFDKKYYNESFAINAVVDPEEDLFNIYHFFSNNELLQKIKVEYNLLDDKNMSAKFFGTPDFFEDYNNNVLKGLLKYSVDSYKKNRVVLFEDIEDIIKINEIIENDPICIKKCHHNGPCLPGHKKLFVDIYGKLYSCEKAIASSSALLIGDLDKGFNYEKIYNIYNIGQLTEEQCKNCWAIRFCNICAVNIDDSKDISLDLKKKYCNDQKHLITERLKTYVLLNKFRKEYIE